MPQPQASRLWIETTTSTHKEKTATRCPTTGLVSKPQRGLKAQDTDHHLGTGKMKGTATKCPTTG